jgi:hypothetical protein
MARTVDEIAAAVAADIALGSFATSASASPPQRPTT